MQTGDIHPTTENEGWTAARQCRGEESKEKRRGKEMRYCKRRGDVEVKIIGEKRKQDGRRLVKRKRQEDRVQGWRRREETR